MYRTVEEDSCSGFSLGCQFSLHLHTNWANVHSTCLSALMLLRLPEHQSSYSRSVRVKNYDETLRTTARQIAVGEVDEIEILLRFHPTIFRTIFQSPG